MSRKVRVRFAPSPTGPLHIGGIRTALYNFLFARRQGGDFTLRIEDTDQNRLVPGAEQYIMNALEWCGLTPDEGPVRGGASGPYRQSERREIYQQHVQMLLDRGAAYYAFDSVEDLDRMREEEMKAGNHSPKYDQRTRMKMSNSLTMVQTEAEKKVADGAAHTVRLLVPADRPISFDDQVRNQVTFHSQDLDDKVLMKADGLPTYHLANVVDDKLMQITHVIRGEEWLSSTAHHVLLYDAFNWQADMPSFTHLPLILKPTGSGKLSKRDGQKFGFPVFPIAWSGSNETDHIQGFNSIGFDPEALLNFLAFLGWNPGTEQEVFSLSELIANFQISQIGKSGARFDYDKAIWFNTQYILKQDASTIAQRALPFLENKGYQVSLQYVEQVARLMRERIHTYAELGEHGAYFFGEVSTFNVKILRKKWTRDIREEFENLVDSFGKVDPFEAARLHDHLHAFIESSGCTIGDVFPLLRIALTGDTKGPDLFEMMEVMGKDRVLNRLYNSSSTFDTALEEGGN